MMRRRVEVKPGSMTVLQARVNMVVIGLFLLFGLGFGLLVLQETPDSEGGLKLLIGGFFVIWVVVCLALLRFFARLARKSGGQRDDTLAELVIDEPAGDFDSRLRKLAQLKEDGLLSEAEYAEKRARIMEEKW